MKKIIAVGTILLTVFLFSSFDKNPSVHETLRVNGAPAGHAGDPAGGNKTCNTTGCHTGPAVVTQTGWITSNIPAAGYVPGTTYTLTATVTDPGHTKFGFQVSPQSATGVPLGTLTSTSTQTTLAGTSVQYINQNNTGTAGVGSKTWSFNWTAPAAGSGSVNFYGAFNSTNSSGNASGDTIYKSVLTVNENQSVGIQVNDFLEKNVTIYPVPSSDFCFVKIGDLKKGNISVDLIDFNGKHVAELVNEYNSQSVFEKRIDFVNRNIEKGIYFLKINQNNSTLLKRIVIN